MLGNIVGGFIVILVGVTLAPTVADSVAQARMNGSGTVDGTGTNMSSSASTILGLTTLFYNLSIASTAIGIAAQGLRNSGLM